MKQELAQNETMRLKQCEKAIEKGLSTFVEVGQALLDIRDGKLYRASHKTFEAYCKERWDISRPRAYELISGAQTVKTIAAAVGANLSAIADKIPEGQAREFKSDPAAAAAEIVERATKGEDAAKAAQDIAARKRQEKERARTARVDQQAANDAARDVARAAQSPAVKAAIEAMEDRHLRGKKPAEQDNLVEEIEELQNLVAAKDQRIAELEAQVSALEPMRLEYERGGFADVIKGLKRIIEGKDKLFFLESEKAAGHLRSATYWKEQAIKLGYSDRVTIDVSGESANG